MRSALFGGGQIMSERLRRAYEEKEKADRKARIIATDSVREEQRLMGELFKHRNPELYPRYRMPREVRQELTARGLLCS